MLTMCLSLNPIVDDCDFSFSFLMIARSASFGSPSRLTAYPVSEGFVIENSSSFWFIGVFQNTGPQENIDLQNSS